jgi:hypothetical protein
MTVGELHKILGPLPDDMLVEMEIEHAGGDELLQADLRSAKVESRCDEVDRLYLWGEHLRVEQAS